MPAGPMTEEHWTDATNESLTPYTRSKTIAERAAWDLVEERGQKDRLAVINPGAILGPALSEDRSYSLSVIERLLAGMPGVPRLGFNFVDVRDVADLHLAAMTSPEAGGERFLAVNEFLWMSEVAQVLRDGLGDAAAKVPTRTIPNLLVRAMAIVDPQLRSITGDLGKKVDYSNAKAVERARLEAALGRGDDPRHRPQRDAVDPPNRGVLVQVVDTGPPAGEPRWRCLFPRQPTPSSTRRALRRPTRPRSCWPRWHAPAACRAPRAGRSTWCRGTKAPAAPARPVDIAGAWPSTRARPCAWRWIPRGRSEHSSRPPAKPSGGWGVVPVRDQIG